MQELDARLRKIFSELFRIEPAAISDDARRGELEGWDSLGHLDLVSVLEREFGVSLDTDRALEIESFADAKRVLRSLLADA